MIGFALFGAGRIGAMHAANVAANPRARLVAVYDVNAAAAQRVAEANGARAVDSVDAALADPDVRAVFIASSTDTHVDLITRSARAGKHVLCEKPIDLDIQRVEQCRRDIAGTGVQIQLGFNRRFDPSHAAVAHAVRRGDIGQLQQIVITSRDPGIAPMEYMKVSGGIFRDMMIHDFDLARFVLGEDPVEVMATGSVLIEPALAGIGDVDSAMVIMKAPSGALVHINNSRLAVYGYDQRLEAFGAKGMVQSDNLRATSLRRWTAETTDAQEPLLHFFIQRYHQAYLDETNAFIDAVNNNTKVPVDFEDGRKALLLANAALESLHTGKAVKVQY